MKAIARTQGLVLFQPSPLSEAKMPLDGVFSANHPMPNPKGCGMPFFPPTNAEAKPTHAPSDSSRQAYRLLAEKTPSSGHKGKWQVQSIRRPAGYVYDSNLLIFSSAILATYSPIDKHDVAAGLGALHKWIMRSCCKIT